MSVLMALVGFALLAFNGWLLVENISKGYYAMCVLNLIAVGLSLSIIWMNIKNPITDKKVEK